MKIQLLLETFEGMHASLDDLGIQKRVSGDTAMLYYRFSDNDGTYEVSFELSNMHESFSRLMSGVSGDISILHKLKTCYIDLTHNFSVQPTGKNNYKYVYTRLLAAVIDVVKTENINAIFFTPYNTKMAIVYISLAKKLISLDSVKKFVPINSTMYISQYAMDVMPKQAVNIILRMSENIDDVKADHKAYVSNASQKKRMSNHFDATYNGKLCEINGVRGIFHEYRIYNTSIDIWLLDPENQTKNLVQIPINKINDIRIIG